LATIEYYRYYATRAAAYFHAAGIGTWPELTSGLVDAFLTHQSKTTGRRGMRPICYALRSFFKFLRRQGHPLPDRLEQFPMPRIYRHEDLPCFIHADRVQRLLDGVDLATNAGIRDYAILLLLSTYGVRAAEVARLELDDIDWAGEIVHLRRRKSGRTDRLPLSIPVGEAILEYLRRARPKTTFRQIFLTTRAPVRPFKNGAIVTGLARKYLVAAGVDLPRLGAHTLRHTTAQHLLTEGFSYKIIGDYLGHYVASSLLLRVVGGRRPITR
jgi:site-specific recombinase XerD